MMKRIVGDHRALIFQDSGSLSEVEERVGVAGKCYRFRSRRINFKTLLHAATCFAHDSSISGCSIFLPAKEAVHAHTCHIVWKE